VCHPHRRAGGGCACCRVQREKPAIPSTFPAAQQPGRLLGRCHRSSPAPDRRLHWPQQRFENTIRLGLGENP
jgi:hypothetical protein